MRDELKRHLKFFSISMPISIYNCCIVSIVNICISLIDVFSKNNNKSTHYASFLSFPAFLFFLACRINQLAACLLAVAIQRGKSGSRQTFFRFLLPFQIARHIYFSGCCCCRSPKTFFSQCGYSSCTYDRGAIMSPFFLLYS